MLRDQCKVGMVVRFGRLNGEKTLSKVIKCNPSKAQVSILEERGQGRGGQVGSIWAVPYSMMEPADGAVVTPPKPQPIGRFLSASDRSILLAIGSVYSELSPENLSADGELPIHQVRQKEADLRRKLRCLCQAFGRQVSEDELYAWEQANGAAVG